MSTDKKKIEDTRPFKPENYVGVYNAGSETHIYVYANLYAGYGVITTAKIAQSMFENFGDRLVPIEPEIVAERIAELTADVLDGSYAPAYEQCFLDRVFACYDENDDESAKVEKPEPEPPKPRKARPSKAAKESK